MSQHLTSKQILECMIDVCDADRHPHVRECASCRAEMDRLAKPLAWFGSSVHYVGQRESHSQFATAPVLVLTPASRNQEVWGARGGYPKRAGAMSLLAHAAAVALLFLIGTNHAVQQMVKGQIELIGPDIAPYKPALKDGAMRGGGGGKRACSIACKQRQAAEVCDQAVRTAYGESARRSEACDGTVAHHPAGCEYSQNRRSESRRSAGAIRAGIERVGSRRWHRQRAWRRNRTRLGAGFGPGSGGNMGGGAYQVGGAVSAPAIVYKVEPEYSEEARKAKFQGNVLLSIVVDEHGNPRDIRVIRPLGLGLDEKAVEAVAKWKFSPGKKDGKPVPVLAQIQVNFRLL